MFFMDTLKKVFIIIAIVAIGLFLYNHFDDKIRQAQVLTATQAQDIVILENKLKLSKVAAESLQVQIKKAQEGKVKPADSYTVNAPSDYEAAEKVAGQINNKDPAVPAAALEKPDRTVVAPQPDNKEYQVGVYKINLAKKNALGSGLESHKSDFYSTISYEHVYKKDKAIEAELHYDIADKKVNGGGVEHKWYF